MIDRFAEKCFVAKFHHLLMALEEVAYHEISHLKVGAEDFGVVVNIS
jgi:hypothetical protein